MSRIAGMLFLAVLLAFSAWSVVHVDVGNTSGIEDGLTWATAWNTVQEGVDDAFFTYGGEDVWVATGVYAESVAMRDDVHLYGGFISGETEFDNRDWENNPTVIEGGGGVYHVVIGANGTLDGFTVRGGNADGTGAAGTEHGAGMYNVSVSPVVANCRFVVNVSVGNGGGMYNESASPSVSACRFGETLGPNQAEYGGGMYNTASSPTVADCWFETNRAESRGGGMANVAGSDPAVDGCTFSANTCYYSGAGMYCSNAAPATVTACSFEGNETDSGHGGGLFIENCSPPVADCDFLGNVANHGSGGGMHLLNASPTLTDCTFSENRSTVGFMSGTGGAMYIGDSSSPSINRCAFTANSSESSAGAIRNSGNYTSLTNCLFLDNTAETTLSGGGAMTNSGTGLCLTNCTFHGNSTTAMQGGAFYESGSSTITNCIFWGDSPDEIFEIVGPATVTYCDVQGGYAGDRNIATAPLFVDAPGGDVRLMPGSLCIDAGTNAGAPADDFRGAPRPLPPGGAYDIGAYEFGRPTASFTSDLTSGCAPLEVTFTDSSDPGPAGPILSWSWDFDGDGFEDSDLESPPAQVYAAPGIYTVSLTVTNAVGEDTETKEDSITAIAANVDFSADVTSGCVALDVQFTDLSTDCGAPITDWSWDLDDDGFEDSDVPNPSYTYTTPGVFTVSLTVTNALGSATETKTDYIAVDGPIPDFSAGETFGYAPLTVDFTNMTTQCLSKITGWGWDFDGDSVMDSYAENPPPHTYGASGIYTVSLTVSTATSSTTETKTDYIEVRGLIHVDADSPASTPDGLSWATAFQEVQDGLDAADALGGSSEVWAAEGDYGEDRTGTDITGALNLRPGVHVYGGFTGYGELEETSRDQRDWRSNVTIIDGSTARAGSAAYHVVKGVDDCTLDGFTVFGGNANGGMTNDDNGAGMFIAAVSPAIAHCVFLDNHADSSGGGVYILNGSPAITGCEFLGNSANAGFEDGGGVYVTGSESSVTLVNCVFWNNTAAALGGGVVVWEDAAVALTNCTFSNNSAGFSGGAFGSWAGSLITATNCVCWGDTPDEVFGATEPVVTYSDVQGGYGDPTDHNMDEDPLFADGPGGDLQLTSDSPCIDAADPAGVPPAPPEDILGVARPQFGGVDMGAYEFTGPVADFTADVTGGKPPLVVHFTDLSQAGSSPITDWLWAFGDLDTSPDPNPTHTYTSAGIYTVSLTVTTADASDTETKTGYIEVREVVFVDLANTTGPWDGASWATAFATLQEAVDAGAALAGPSELWVADGLYDEDRSAGSPTGSLEMAGRVHLYGGFTGLGELEETERDQRDWETNVTTIDGSNGRGPGVPAQCTVRGADNATLNGFTVTGGNADGSTFPTDNCGGGMNNFQVSPLVDHCTFDGNVASMAGGGMYNGDDVGSSPTSPIVANCRFINNLASVGGGLYNGMMCSATVTGCEFDDNDAMSGGLGGAIASVGCAPTFADCVLEGNSAPDGWGGGMVNSGMNGAVTRCVFEGNSAPNGWGGAIMNMGSETSITDCTFDGNTASGGLGGAIYNEMGPSPSMDACTLRNNSADEGGGMWNGLDAEPELTNCIFRGNQADTGDGGAIYNNGSALPRIVNCTFNTNSAPNGTGGAMFSESGLTPYLKNSILWGDTASGAPDEIAGQSAAVSYCNVEGGASGIHNIDEDPLFVNPSVGDYRLKQASPCIDEGNQTDAPPDDIRDVSRPQGEDVDIGAYEFADSDLPTASFSGDVDLGYVPLEVQFMDESLPGGSPITDWLWDFGDTGSSPDPNPLHTYAGVGTYRVYLTVTTLIGNDTAGPMTVRVGEAPAFTTQPVSLKRYVGETAQFTVAASGGLGDLHYQWKLDDGLKTVHNVGGDSPVFTIPSVALSDAGTCWCEVTDDVATHMSDTATLEVGLPVTFTSQPDDVQAYVGEQAQFSVVADHGLGTLHYQWKFDDGLKAVYDVGDDSPTLIVDPLGMDDVGAYWCEAADDLATYVSDTATLDAAEHLAITQHPVGGDKIIGDSHTFVVLAGGGYAPLVYAWRKDGTPIPDASDATLTLDPLDLADSGVYVAVVSDSYEESMQSNPAELTVTPGTPVTGTVGLGLLAGMAALAGVLALRRTGYSPTRQGRHSQAGGLRT